MQKNNWSGYVRVSSVQPAVPTGTVSRQGDKQFQMTVTVTAPCGSIWNEDTRRFDIENREVDLVFFDLTQKNAELIVPQSELYINGATVVTWSKDWNYNPSKLNLVGGDRDGIISTMFEALKDKCEPIYHDELRRQIGIIVQKSRRVTVVRVMPGQWSLQATPSQLRLAHKVEASLEDL